MKKQKEEIAPRIDASPHFHWDEKFHEEKEQLACGQKNKRGTSHSALLVAVGIENVDLLQSSLNRAANS